MSGTTLRVEGGEGQARELQQLEPGLLGQIRRDGLAAGQMAQITEECILVPAIERVERGSVARNLESDEQRLIVVGCRHRHYV